jgi:tRNA (cmo5U34)-methyltransferase
MTNETDGGQPVPKLLGAGLCYGGGAFLISLLAERTPMSPQTLPPAQPASPDSAQTFHASRARRYDDTIRRVIPGYDTLHQMAALLLTNELPDSGRLLLVGTGTGAELAPLGQANPDWRFVACDPSAGMLAVAEERAQELGLADRVRFYPCTADQLTDDEALFDAATCLLVLHFVPDDGSKLALLQSIAARLKPGGAFVFADMYEDPNTPRFRRLLAAWTRWQAKAGIPQAEIEKGLAHVRRDIHFVAEERLTTLLEQAGFTPPERFFGAFLFAGYVCHRRG